MHTLTDMQAKAVKLAKDWYFSKESQRRPFVLTGYAGTGKSFTISKIVEELNLFKDQIKFVAFTGMAASVISKNGNPATTIHRLIYNPVKTKNGGVKFVLKDSLDSDIKLIIVDEFSTVGNDLMTDLEEFGIPILLVGDRGQLPPVKSQANKYLDLSDVNLTETMRQALDNPIIYIATRIRNGLRVDFGNYDDIVHVITKDEMNLDHIQWADQILANTNKVVDLFNNTVRRDVYQLDSPFPYEGEKLLCLRNNWDRCLDIDNIDQYLVNGSLGIVGSLGEYKPDIDAFEGSFQPLFLNTEKEHKDLLIDGIYFSEGIKNDSDLFDNPGLKGKYKKTMIHRKSLEDTTFQKVDKFTYGYAISVYKSQGSEFDNVLYYRDNTSAKLQQKSDYVAVTRAKESLIMVK